MNRAGASQELFERWTRVVAQHRSELALVDIAAGERWSFAELLRQSEAVPPSGGASFPSGHGAQFVLGVLRAWRAGVPSCPLDAGQPTPELPAVPSRYAHLKLTSASTGMPKSIAFTAEQLAADAANIVATMGLRPDWPNLACISLAHSYGFSNLLLPLVLHGIPLILLPAPLPEVVLAGARACPAITLPAVPALWRTWHDSDVIPENTKLAISAGAPLPLELEARIFDRYGLKIHNFYGSSECGGIAYDRTEVPRSEPALAGTALENVALTLSGSGTLVVESAAVGATYWPKAHASLQAPRFETADLAEIRDGQVFLRGRLTDLINVAGRKAAPEVIEAAVKSHPAVAECIVFGVPEARSDRFEKIVACIRASEGLNVSELTRFLSSRLPGWQMPREYWFTDELAPNERGKLSRAVWRERYKRCQRSTGNVVGNSPNLPGGSP